MNFLKIMTYIRIGTTVVNGILDAAKDGKITVYELLGIAVKVAESLGVDVNTLGFDLLRSKNEDSAQE